MNDSLGDRMKQYESEECGRRFMPGFPILARVDGRAFHSFTRGLARPFDPALSRCLIDTAMALAQETNACMTYTQSDEISLAWHVTEPGSSVWFDGRITKMTSQLAALATLHFYRAVLKHLPPTYAERLPSFDARVWLVPSRTEGANAFLWREWDATKNSITMAASTVYSPKQLQGQNSAQKLQLLKQRGIDWEQYPTAFKRGAYVQRRTLERAFTTDEVARLPAKHQAHSNPALTVRRSQLEVIEMPPLVAVVNREEVIFAGAAPLTAALTSPAAEAA